MSFQLHEQLQKDCYVLGRLDASQVLLLDNALVPWFILVPETDATEFHQLDNEVQLRVLAEINQLSACVEQTFTVEKLNVAIIGNKVPQMHIHVIGRNRNDYCWPGVVWASTEKQPYRPAEVDKIRSDIVQALCLSPAGKQV
jgi:diadenosine tetraphosphate (Ap4A) HIT family hydrolase